MSDLVHKEVTSGGATSTERHLDSVIICWGRPGECENSCCNQKSVGRNLFRSCQHLASLKSKNRRSLSNRSCLIFCSIYFSLPVMILLCHSSDLFEYAMAYLNDLTSASLAFVHEEEMTSTADTGRCDYGLKIVSEWLSYLQSLSLLRPWTPTAA
jgi:hypothetical protein